MRLWVAVWPPPAVVAQLAGIERPPLPAARWTTEDQWHVTLRFLGEVGADDIEVGKTSLGQLASAGPLGQVAAGAGPVGKTALHQTESAREPLGPVTAMAGLAVARFGPSVLCVPVAGLDELAAAVSRLTAGIGAPLGGRPFRGHLTIARAKRRRSLPAMPVPFSASWEVQEVTLVASHLHSAGARYEIISRVPLAP